MKWRKSPMASVAEVKTHAAGAFNQGTEWRRRRVAPTAGQPCVGDCALRRLAPTPASTTSTRNSSDSSTLRQRNAAIPRTILRGFGRAHAPNHRGALTAARSFDQPATAILEVERPGPSRVFCRATADARSFGQTSPGRGAHESTIAGHIPSQRSNFRLRLYAEEVRGQIRQLMGLVEDHCIDAGKEVAKTLLLQHHVRHQKMMIHDDQVGTFSTRRAGTT